MYLVALFLLSAGTLAQSVSYSYTATITATATVFETLTTCLCLATAKSSTTSSSTLPPIVSTTVSVSTSQMTQSTTTGLTIVTSASGTVTTSTTPGTTLLTLSTSSSTISTLTTSTTSASGSTGTDDAYINAVLRHHNVHRTNHSAIALTWSPGLADTAQVIAQTCVYGHDTSVGGGGYGQNIGAGYPSTPLGMGNFITEGLYNGEVNKYIYYDTEPDLSTLNQWGHFTQVVWKSSTAVGCYTAECTASGLGNVGSGVPPFFTVCNYSPPGNFVGMFAQNIGVSIGMPTVHADY